MTIKFAPPQKYGYDISAFRKFGKENIISNRVKYGLENVLAFYTTIAPLHARETSNNPQNYQVERVYVVGSCARENKIQSDLDFLLMTPRLDLATSKAMKVMLSLYFYNFVPKLEAIDSFFIRNEEDIFDERPCIEITEQVDKILDKYNEMLLEPVIENLISIR